MINLMLLIAIFLTSSISYSQTSASELLNSQISPTVGANTVMVGNLSFGVTADTTIRLDPNGTARDVTFDNTFKSGSEIRVCNTHTGETALTAKDNVITLKSNDTSTIRKVYPGTCADMLSLDNTPVSPSSWKSLNRVISRWHTFIGASQTTWNFFGDPITTVVPSGATGKEYFAWRRDGKRLVFAALFDCNGAGCNQSDAQLNLVNMPAIESGLSCLFTGGASNGVHNITTGYGRRGASGGSSVPFGVGCNSNNKIGGSEDLSPAYLADNQSLSFEGWVVINQWEDFSN